MAGLLVAAGLLLALAGVSKLRDPAAAASALAGARLGLPRGAVAALTGPFAGRALGVVQVVAGLSTLVLDRRAAGAVVLVAYGGLAAFSWRLSRVAPDVGCGCFGADDGPVRARHVALDLVLAGVGAAALLLPGPGFAAELAASPLAGVPLAVLVAVLAGACYLLMTAMPDLSAARSASEATR